MQELLGRLTALDPAASQSLRVIACFDELIAGDVGVRGLLSAAAALSGRSVGLVRGSVITRVDRRGELLSERVLPQSTHRVLDDVAVWIDNPDTMTAALDSLIVERLALALLIRLDRRRTVAPRRDLALVVDRGTNADERREAAVRLGLISTVMYRVVVAPLFATWAQHPRGPEDVVATQFGPVHTSVVTAETSAAATPLGIGAATGIEDLDRSFRTALIALRLHDGGIAGSRADDFGGLAEILADLPDDRRDRGDQVTIELVMVTSWGAATIDALVRAGSIREAARFANVHHSTMSDRVEIIASTVKFDPMNGIGRTRLGLAYLQWRLRTSRVLEFTPAVETI